MVTRQEGRCVRITDELPKAVLSSCHPIRHFSTGHASKQGARHSFLSSLASPFFPIQGPPGKTSQRSDWKETNGDHSACPALRRSVSFSSRQSGSSIPVEAVGVPWFLSCLYLKVLSPVAVASFAMQTQYFLPACHISYRIGCLIKIIIKIDLLISMHLLRRSHSRIPLSGEDVTPERQGGDPDWQPLAGCRDTNIWRNGRVVQLSSRSPGEEVGEGREGSSCSQRTTWSRFLTASV